MDDQSNTQSGHEETQQIDVQEVSSPQDFHEEVSRIHDNTQENLLTTLEPKILDLIGRFDFDPDNFQMERYSKYQGIRDGIINNQGDSATAERIIEDNRGIIGTWNTTMKEKLELKSKIRATGDMSLISELNDIERKYIENNGSWQFGLSASTNAIREIFLKYQIKQQTSGSLSDSDLSCVDQNTDEFKKSKIKAEYDLLDADLKKFEKAKIDDPEIALIRRECSWIGINLERDLGDKDMMLEDLKKMKERYSKYKAQMIKERFAKANLAFLELPISYVDYNKMAYNINVLNRLFVEDNVDYIKFAENLKIIESISNKYKEDKKMEELAKLKETSKVEVKKEDLVETTYEEPEPVVEKEEPITQNESEVAEVKRVDEDDIDVKIDLKPEPNILEENQKEIIETVIPEQSEQEPDLIIDVDNIQKVELETEDVAVVVNKEPEPIIENESEVVEIELEIENDIDAKPIEETNFKPEPDVLEEPKEEIIEEEIIVEEEKPEFEPEITTDINESIEVEVEEMKELKDPAEIADEESELVVIEDKPEIEENNIELEVGSEDLFEVKEETPITHEPELNTEADVSEKTQETILEEVIVEEEKPEFDPEITMDINKHIEMEPVLEQEIVVDTLDQKPEEVVIEDKPEIEENNTELEISSEDLFEVEEEIESTHEMELNTEADAQEIILEEVIVEEEKPESDPEITTDINESIEKEVEEMKELEDLAEKANEESEPVVIEDKPEVEENNIELDVSSEDLFEVEEEVEITQEIEPNSEPDAQEIILEEVIVEEEKPEFDPEITTDINEFIEVEPVLEQEIVVDTLDQKPEEVVIENKLEVEEDYSNPDIDTEELLEAEDINIEFESESNNNANINEAQSEDDDITYEGEDEVENIETELEQSDPMIDINPEEIAKVDEDQNIELPETDGDDITQNIISPELDDKVILESKPEEDVPEIPKVLASEEVDEEIENDIYINNGRKKVDKSPDDDENQTVFVVREDDDLETTEEEDLNTGSQNGMGKDGKQYFGSKWFMKKKRKRGSRGRKDSQKRFKKILLSLGQENIKKFEAFRNDLQKLFRS